VANGCATEAHRPRLHKERRFGTRQFRLNSFPIGIARSTFTCPARIVVVQCRILERDQTGLTPIVEPWNSVVAQINSKIKLCTSLPPLRTPLYLSYPHACAAVPAVLKIPSGGSRYMAKNSNKIPKTKASTNGKSSDYLLQGGRMEGMRGLLLRTKSIDREQGASGDLQGPLARGLGANVGRR